MFWALLYPTHFMKEHYGLTVRNERGHLISWGDSTPSRKDALVIDSCCLSLELTHLFLKGVENLIHDYLVIDVGMTLLIQECMLFQKLLSTNLLFHIPCTIINLLLESRSLLTPGTSHQIIRFVSVVRRLMRVLSCVFTWTHVISIHNQQLFDLETWRLVAMEFTIGYLFIPVFVLLIDLSGWVLFTVLIGQRKL